MPERNHASLLARDAPLSAWRSTGVRCSDARSDTSYHGHEGAKSTPVGCIPKLSKILGHSSVAITQQVYAHLHPDAFVEDYSRVAFAMPEKVGSILKLHR